MGKNNDQNNDRNERSLAGFSSLTDDLVLVVASWLPVADLLRFQCVTSDLARLDTSRLWAALCRARWRRWTRYRSSVPDDDDWKREYLRVEREATRTELRLEDLSSADSLWYLAFRTSGVRGETRSDFLPVRFDTDEGFMYVPHYPPLPFEIVGGACDGAAPPSAWFAGRDEDYDDEGPSFSTKTWLRVANFPPHFVARARNAEWLIVNANVIMVSTPTHA